MLRGRRYSKTGDGNATKKKIFEKGGRKWYKEEDIPKRGTEMIQRRGYSEKGEGTATKTKIFQNGERKC